MSVLLALVIASSARQTPSSAEVLRRSQAAYDAVHTLVEDVTGSEKMGKGTAHIVFKRPGQMRITGTAMFGSPYQLLCTGKGVWVYNANSWNTAQSPEMGIATITGLSMNAGTAVPAALFHTKWGSVAGFSAAGKVSRDSIGGHSTFRVDFSQPFKRSVWFDSKSYFMVKSETSITMQNTVTTITVNFGKPIVNKPVPASAFKK